MENLRSFDMNEVFVFFVYFIFVCLFFPKIEKCAKLSILQILLDYAPPMRSFTEKNYFKLFSTEAALGNSRMSSNLTFHLAIAKMQAQPNKYPLISQ